ncbi:MAG: hypothetical protein KKF00_03970, partial [Proteobacteria bacterium]|nr:hypothetical protein [Pseudomonadota bacterium]
MSESKTINKKSRVNMVRIMGKTFARLALVAGIIFLHAPSYAAAPEIPKDIKWLTNDSDPVFASSEA